MAAWDLVEDTSFIVCLRKSDARLRPDFEAGFMKEEGSSLPYSKRNGREVYSVLGMY